MYVGAERAPLGLLGALSMTDIAALNLDSSVKPIVYSPAFVSRYKLTGSNFFTGAGGAGGAGAAALGAVTFFDATFFGAAFFFAGAFFFAAAFGAVVFFAVGIRPPVALKVSITGCCGSWFDTGYRNSIVWCGRAGNCLV